MKRVFRILCHVGAASFAGTAPNLHAATAEPRKQLNTSQALPGMSQRIVASQLVTPSPHPREQTVLLTSSPSRPLTTRRVQAPAASRSTSPDPPHDGPTAPRPSILSSAGLTVRGEGFSKPASDDDDIEAAAEGRAKRTSSWQLLQESGRQPRMTCRSKKVGAVSGLWKVVHAGTWH